MRLPTLVEGDRRALLVGALLTATFLGWTVVARPYLLALGAARERLDHDRALLVREQALLASEPHHRAAFDIGAEHLLAEAPRLFGGTDNGAVGAALVEYLQRLSAASRVFVAQVDARSAVAIGGGLRSMSVEIEGESDLEGLVTLLTALETGPKLVRVDRLDIRRTGPAGSVSSIGQSSGADAEVLAFGLTVTGFTLGDPPEEPARTRTDEPTAASAPGTS